MRWDPNKEPPGGNLFVLIGGWTHCFTILFSYWFSITTIKNPIVPNKKKTEVRHQSYFSIWGSFSNRKKGRYFATPQDTPTKWLNPQKVTAQTSCKVAAAPEAPEAPEAGFFAPCRAEVYIEPLCFKHVSCSISSIPQKRNGTLWLFNIAMKNGPFIAGLPNFKMVDLSMAMLVITRWSCLAQDDLSRELVQPPTMVR